MAEKNNNHSPEENGTPLEIPANEPGKDIEPIKAQNKTSTANKMKGIKIAYTIAILFALGGLIATRLSINNSFSDLNTPLNNNTNAESLEESNFNLYDFTEEPDFQVRQNVTDVPDTRTEIETENETEATTEKQTEKVTEKDNFAKPYSDYYTLPFGSDILNDYNETAPMYNATMGDWRTHPAVDFKGTEGGQVMSIAYGKVTAIYDDALYGTTVEIDHGNKVVAKYCGLNKDTLEIKEGSTVKDGALIGYIDTVPCEKADLPHLHFEIKYKGKYVDPLELMGRSPN